MRKFVVFALVCLLHQVSFAQSECPLSRGETRGQVYYQLLMDDFDRDGENLNPEVSYFYKGAPLEAIGNFTSIDGTLLCSGYIANSNVVITHKACAKLVASDTHNTYFSRVVAGELVVHLVESTYVSGNLGGIKVTDPRYGGATTALNRTTKSYVGQAGWMIKGASEKSSDPYSMMLNDYCWVHETDDFKSYFACKDRDDFIAGSVVFGKLCGQWLIVGIKSPYGDYFIDIQRDHFSDIMNAFNVICVYKPSKKCTQVKRNEAAVRQNLPYFRRD